MVSLLEQLLLLSFGFVDNNLSLTEFCSFF